MRLYGTCGTLLMSTFLAHCGTSSGGSSPTTNVIRIGALADNSGSSATLAYSESMSLAASQMNEGLSQAGANFRFDAKILDSQSLAAQSTTDALSLVNDMGVKAVVTDISGDTLAVAKLNYDPASTMKEKVPVTCYTCSSSFLNNPNAMDADPVTQAAERDADNWLYRVFFNGSYESAISVQIALNRPNGGDVNGDGHLKIGVYASNDAFGKSSSAGIQAAVQQLAPTGATVETIFYDPTNDANTYDFGPDLARVMDTTNETTQMQDGVPDMVFLAVLGLPATATIKAYRAGSYTAPLQAATAFRRDYILRSIGQAAEGVEGDSPQLFANNASGQAFASAFQTANGSPPEMPAAGAYDAIVSLMLGAMEAAVSLPNPADVTPAAIRDGLAKIGDPAGTTILPTPSGFAQAYQLIKTGAPINYTGASGYLPWNSVGDTFPQLVHWKVQNQQFVELESYDCNPDHPQCTKSP
jgi:hypothetical protein